MPPVMSTAIRTLSSNGRAKTHFVTLPLVTALLDEPLKYLVLPGDEPAPATPEPSMPVGND